MSRPMYVEFNRSDEFLHAEYELPGVDERTLRPLVGATPGDEMVGGGWDIPDEHLLSLAATHLPGGTVDLGAYSYQVTYEFRFGPNAEAGPATFSLIRPATTL